MSADSIYSQLIKSGLSTAGACGLMGNLQAESSLVSNIAQRGMTSLTDEQYTLKFDLEPENCYRDGVGYGLAQWTYWSRKKALSEFVNALGVSVGDESGQIKFIVHELRTDYPALYSFLCTTEDLYTAADRVCREYERPAVNNVQTRYEFAKKLYALYSEPQKEPAQDEPYYPPDVTILTLQALLVGNGYTVEVTGYKTEAFLGKLREFVKDIGG